TYHVNWQFLVIEIHGLIPITLAGLFVTAYLQYRRVFNARSKNISFCGTGTKYSMVRFFSRINGHFQIYYSKEPAQYA
ncbi:cytochrome b6/f complex, subunit 5, partial [Cynara cardunculus var. scolymus]